MAYVKTTWVDDVTPLSAGNFNNIEDGIEDADAEITAHVDAAMPHKFEDDGTVYRWGFRTVDGAPQFIYEEV
jgi:hypothetical protein